MRIAILTQPLHLNYGGIMQCYALKTVLEGMGHEVVVLNRRFKSPGPKVVVLRFGSVAKCIAKRYLLGRKDIAVMSPWSERYNIRKPSKEDETAEKEIDRFIREHIPQTAPLRSSQALLKCVEEVAPDCFIVGSDQVWRERYSPRIEDYFLGFLPEDDKRLKITYAASFGTADAPISEKHIQNCINLAGRFSAISVREESGVEIMRNTFGREAKLVLDPTLLLSAGDYAKVAGDAGNCGLVSYVLDEEGMKGSILEDVGRTLGLRQTKMGMVAEHSASEMLSAPSVECWLAAFAGAEFVVTDSFHGCVFSIINRKPFIAIANRDRGLERFTSLLGAFGLTDRLVFSKEDFEARKELLLSPIDYAPVIEKHRQLVQDSLAWLKEKLEK
jgi:hypothetical protein